MTINIEITEKPDTQALAAIHAACFPKGWKAEDIGRMLETEGTMAFVVEGGFALLRVLAGEAEILTLAVEEGHRRQGLGRELVRQMVFYAAVQHAEAIFLEVGEDNRAARRLYIAAGFMAVSRRPHYYGGKETAIVMRRELR